MLGIILLAALATLIFWLVKGETARRTHTAAQQELYEALTIQFREDATVEYGGDFHPSDYVIAAGGDLSCEGAVDTMMLGDQKVIYTVSARTQDGADVNREYEKVFTVKDVLSPVITLEKSIVQIRAGEAYDPAANVVSVMDPVDGSVDYELDDGGLDTAKNGTYVIRVSANDRSGNRSSKAFKIIVGNGSEPEEETPTPTPTPTPSAEPTPTPAADTASPVITLASDTVSLEVGESFNPGSLVVSINDETDGPLEYTEALVPGTFTLTSDVNTDTPGSYTVTVTAADKGGNRTERTVSVTVKEPEPTPAPTPTPTPSPTPSPTPASTPAPTPKPAVNGVPNSSDPKGQIYNFLTGSMGFSKAQACGILANMHRESRFNSTADNGLGYYGLCQWGGERKDNLFDWCEKNGYDPETIDGQLHFLQYEMPLYYPNTTAQLRACSNDEEGARRACWIFAIGYEVAGEYYAEMSMDKAAEYFNQ